MIKKRLGKIYIPIDSIPLNATKIARDNQINLHEMFQVVIESATNPNLTITKTFRNLPHLENFVNMATEQRNENIN